MIFSGRVGLLHGMLSEFILAALVFVTIFSGVSTVSALANCPNSCQCDDDTLVVKCGEGTLDVLPIALNPSIKRLIIKNNKIKTIDSSIQFYAELNFLDLSFNDFITIPQRTFAYQRKLQELHLNQNKIGQISNKTFIGLASLTVLNLRGNLLAELESETFTPMSKLEELNLGQNRISHIDSHAFDGLTQLSVLYLDDNTLATVPASITFNSMTSLAELYLGTNSFLSIPSSAFENLKGLTRLDLRGAGLQNISNETYKGLGSLRFLDMSDNSLQVVPTEALRHLERLEELIIGQNNFEIIGAGSFVGLRHLRRLEINGAQNLRRINAGALSSNTNLEYLNISSNRLLSEIDENALSGLPHLRHIVLKENQLSTLAEGLFPWLDLTTMDLSDNPIICDCRLLWLHNLLLSKNNSSNQISNVICKAPELVRDQALISLSPQLLGCAHSDAKKQAMIGMILVIIAATVSGLAFLLYGCRRRLRDLLKGGWGNSALGRKEREYRKTFSDEEYMSRQLQQQQHPQATQQQLCSLVMPYTTTNDSAGGNYNDIGGPYAAQSQYQNNAVPISNAPRSIPVTEL